MERRGTSGRSEAGGRGSILAGRQSIRQMEHMRAVLGSQGQAPALAAATESQARAVCHLSVGPAAASTALMRRAQPSMLQTRQVQGPLS
jgi:hypothetical protein